MKATEMLHILKVQNKRLFIIWLITFIAFIGLLGYTIYLLNDIGTTTETSTQEIQGCGSPRYHADHCRTDHSRTDRSAVRLSGETA